MLKDATHETAGDCTVMMEEKRAESAGDCTVMMEDTSRISRKL